MKEVTSVVEAMPNSSEQAELRPVLLEPQLDACAGGALIEGSVHHVPFSVAPTGAHWTKRLAAAVDPTA